MTGSTLQAADEPLRRRIRGMHLGFVALLLTISLAACGDSADDDGGASTAGSGGEDVEVTVVNPLKGHPFTKSMECGAEREAKRLGVDLSIKGTTQYSVANVTQVLNAVAADRPQGVVFMVWDEIAYQNAISNLASSGAKVVAIDGAPRDRSNVISSITADGRQGGAAAAKAMLTKVEPGDKVLVIERDPSDTFQKARGDGLIDTLKAADVEVLPVQYSQEDVTKSTSIVEATLAKHPDLKGIYVTNGTDGPPAYRVLASERKTDQVALVEYDASPEQVERVKSGKILATVAQRPDVEAELAVRYIVDSIRGRQVPKEKLTAVNLVTKDNLDEPETQEALYKTEC